MKILPRYEVIVSYDEDQKLSVWWRVASNRDKRDSFFRLKEGADVAEKTNQTYWFGHDCISDLEYKKIGMIVVFHWDHEAEDMLASAMQMIADERAKTVSYFDFLALRKEFDDLREQVKSKLKIED